MKNKEKLCKGCNNTFPINPRYWYSNKGGKFNLRSKCKDCILKENRSREGRYTEERHNQWMKRKYGLTHAWYLETIEKQKFKCNICSKKDIGRKTSRYFVVEHCHKTGKIRGLVCHPCNILLAQLENMFNDIEDTFKCIRKHLQIEINEKNISENNMVNKLLNEGAP